MESLDLQTGNLMLHKLPTGQILDDKQIRFLIWSASPKNERMPKTKI